MLFIVRRHRINKHCFKERHLIKITRVRTDAHWPWRTQTYTCILPWQMFTTAGVGYVLKHCCYTITNSNCLRRSHWFKLLSFKYKLFVTIKIIDEIHPLTGNTVVWNIIGFDFTLEILWSLVADIAGGKEAESVWEHGVEDNIWT